VHSGVLYPQERDPRPFFSALATLKRNGHIAAQNLQIVLRATGSDSLYAPMLAEQGIADIVRLEPVVAYREALREMLRADALLLFQGSICNHQTPAKIYEYYRAGRPIFGLVDPAGISAHMLRDVGVVDIADIASTEQIAERLLQLLAALREGRRQGVARDVAARHSRRSRSAELATLLDRITDRN
jgi:hypothetical protein